MLRAIFQVLYAEFVSSIDKYQPPSVVQERFLARDGDRKYKILFFPPFLYFRFAPKLPSSCINQNVQWDIMRVGSLDIF